MNLNAPASYNQPPSTPQLNVPDGIWNNGEGFRRSSLLDANHGGHLGGAEPGVELTDIFGVEETIGGTPGWKQIQYVDEHAGGTTRNLWHFVGYLRPGQLGPYPTPAPGGPGTIEDAAFEIFLPDPIPSTTQIVLAIGAWATTGKPSIADGGWHAYPGKARHDGLVKFGDQPPKVFRQCDPAFPALAASSGITVMYGYIIPRVFSRAAVFEVQRYRELREAMRQMLMAPSNNYRHPPQLPVMQLASNAPPCIIIGGSHGGFMSQAMCVRFPGEFQGAYAEVFGPSLRRVLADQFALHYFATRTGLQSYGGAYGPHETLEWGRACRLMDTSPGSPGRDFFNLSTLVRHRRGELHGPFIWLQPDEDTIGHGTDSLPILTGTREYTPRWVSSSLPTLAFTTVDRRCHESGWHRTALNGAGPAWEGRDDALELVPQALQEWTAIVPPVPPRLTDDGTEDSYAWVLDRALPPDDVPGANPPLFLDPTFGAGTTPGRSAGAGLALGRDESLRFADVPGAGKSVFVGGADGVVTRFVLDTATKAFDVAAQSVPLGAFVTALAVGELNDGHSGMEVVVGTKQHLFILDAATLAVLNHREMQGGFDHTWPRRIQIANVIDSPDYPGQDIVMTTLMGHLLVFSSDDGLNFIDMVDFGEPGIQDFAVLEGQVNVGAHTASVTPVLLLSLRGHTINVSLNDINNPLSRNPAPAEMQSWTDGEHGLPADLEIVDAPNGNGKVAVALYSHEGSDGTKDIPQIRCFDALTMRPAGLGTHGIRDGLGWKGLNVLGLDMISADIAPVHLAGTNGALAGFVVLLGARIAWVPADGTRPIQVEGYKLDGFAPASRALAVITADLTTRAGEIYKEEIILSTLAGHLVWMHLEDLLANGGSEYLLSVGPPPDPVPPDAVIPYTNQTLSGQWGLIAADAGQGMKLYGANQAGGLYEIDPATGVGTRRGVFRETHDTSLGTTRQPSVVTSPIRALAQLGSTVTQSSALEAAMPASSGSGAPLRWIETSPWEDWANNIVHPLWVKGWRAIGNAIVDYRSQLPVIDGFAAFVAGGDAIASGGSVPGATKQLQWWGGDVDAFSNMIQGAYVSSTHLLDNWYSSKTGPYSWDYAPYPPQQAWHGSSAADCKDLRNEVRQWTAINNLQALRVAQDGHGTVVAGSTPGGSLVLLRPGRAAGQTNQDYGTVLWDSTSVPSPNPPWDEGMHAMGLALRPVPGDPNQALDIFLGVGITQLEPGPFWSVPNAEAGKLTGGIAWYRWTSTSSGTGTMVRMGLLHLDPDSNNAIGARGGFGVCGLAVGDVLASQAGDELVATTLEGDLFVFAIPSSGMLLPTNILFRTWVRGALGVNNSIVVHDFDNDGKKELYASGSQGIWKWRQP